jgi:hypothetical protein
LSQTTQDSDGDLPIPDPDDSGVVQVITENGFQLEEKDRRICTFPQFQFYEDIPMSTEWKSQ